MSSRTAGKILYPSVPHIGEVRFLFSIFRTANVLLSQTCHNKPPKTWRFTITEVYPLTVLGPGSDIKVLAGLVYSAGSEGEFILCLFPNFHWLCGILGAPWFVGTSLQSLLPSSRHLLLFLSACLKYTSLFSYRTLVFGCRAQPKFRMLSALDS